MRTDTAGNQIFDVPAICGRCGGPTDTGGLCIARCQTATMSPLIAARTPVIDKADLSLDVKGLEAAIARVDDWAGADHFEDCPTLIHERGDCPCPDTDEGQDICSDLGDTECDCYLGVMRSLGREGGALLALARELAAELKNFRSYYITDNLLGQNPEANPEVARASALLTKAREAGLLDSTAPQEHHRGEVHCKPAPVCHCTGDGHKPDCTLWISLEHKL